MKLLDTQTIREWDKYTIDHEPISSLDLMERAAEAFVERFCDLFPKCKVDVWCGAGNNGGDGLAIARLLHHLGYEVQVFLCEAEHYSVDNLQNQKRLPKELTFRQMGQGEIPTEINTHSLLIDALFGSGLSRPLEGYWADLIQSLNQYSRIVSIDIPSGLFAQPQAVETAVHADYTISFQIPKWSFLFEEFESFVGEWLVVDIGLDSSFPGLKDNADRLLNTDVARGMLKTRSKFGHKGTYGHALLIAGSLGKLGAAILSSRACLRSGVGLLSVQIPHCGYGILQTAIPEAMVRPDRNEYYISDLPGDLDKFSAVGMGPGLDQRSKTIEMLEELLVKIHVPLVIDADGLNILASKPDLLSRLPEHTILTPHPGEFDRLFGRHETSYERLETARVKARELGLVLVLKGAHTAIVSREGQVSMNTTGNSGMATAGSGDVLTGIVLSLLAQGYPAFEAAQLAVFWHGLAGDCSARKQASISLIASDIVRCLGFAYAELSKG
jgi:NAD(P)H-hydrate epimerase